MKSYKDFMLQEEYLDEGKGRAAKEALKRGAGKGKKLLDKLKGKGGKGKKGGKGGKGGGAAGTLGRAGLVGGAALVGKGALDLLGGAAREVGKRAGRIWAGGVNDLDSDGPPSDHQGLPKAN